MVPEGRTTSEAIDANHLCWVALDEEVRNNPSATNTLEYLRDENLERRVRFTQKNKKWKFAKNPKN